MRRTCGYEYVGLLAAWDVVAVDGEDGFPCPEDEVLVHGGVGVFLDFLACQQGRYGDLRDGRVGLAVLKELPLGACLV